jgi:aryl-alcohol dehydrogenase-like predicted oxidoreductase
VSQLKTAPEPNKIFTAEKAAASLHASLAALQTDRIDVWLLHELKAADIPDDRLLRLLEDAVQQGKIGSFGVGSGREHISELMARYPQYCPIAQYEWSILEPAIPPTPYFRIHHRALSGHFQSLCALLSEQPEQCERWSQEVGEDLGKPETLANLMLKASLVLNPQSVVLFSSKRSSHIQANVSTADNPHLEAPARRLFHLFQREPVALK